MLKKIIKITRKNSDNKKYLLCGAGKISVNKSRKEDLAKTSIARQNFMKKAECTVVHEHF